MNPKIVAALGLVMAIGLASIRGSAPASSAAPKAPATWPIKHVVVIYQENHSFDNALGIYCSKVAAGTIVRLGLGAKCDGVAGAPTMPGSPGPTTMPDVVPQIAHSVNAQQTVMNKGLMNGWRKIKGCTNSMCLSQVTPAQSPNLTALANKFVIADRTFESSSSPSWVGHIQLVAVTKDGFYGDNPIYQAGPGVPPQKSGWGCDSNNVAAYGAILPTVLVPSCVPDRALSATKYPYGGAFRATPAGQVPTIMDELDTAGLSWRLYAGRGPASPGGWDICPTFAKCLYTPQVKSWLPNTRVITDATAGTLPSFSVVIPTGPQSQHNGHSWKAGDSWIGQVVSAIENGPNWSSTAIFLTWDDCGCFYDHVNPLALNPSWGIRVPMLVISPYARSGATDSGATTFSGILAFTEKLFGLAPLGTADATAYDFEGSFNWTQVPLSGVTMVREKVPASSARWIASHPPPPNDPT